METGVSENMHNERPSRKSKQYVLMTPHWGIIIISVTSAAPKQSFGQELLK